MNQQTIDMLTEMKMTAMAAEFANQIQDVSFNSIGFEERLSMVDGAFADFNADRSFHFPHSFQFLP